MEPRVITGDQAASYLSIDYHTLMLRARKGEIPCIRWGKRQVRFDKFSLDKWIEQEIEKCQLNPMRMAG